MGADGGGGGSFRSGKFAGGVRKRLMMEHLGLLPKEIVENVRTPGGRLTVRGEEQVEDCLSHAFFHDVWGAVAKENTQLFEYAFICAPSDEMTSSHEVTEKQKLTPLAEIDRLSIRKLLKNKIRGNLVQLPYRFLEKENLLPDILTKEGLMFGDF